MDATHIGSSDHWVFGYGSLIWNPGFAHVAARLAVLHGAHRSLCIYSHHHRGTPEKPGLVFGLVEGGSCRGMAFAVDEAEWLGVREYLRAREQVTSVYREATRRVRLDDGREVKALAFLVDRHHEQYAGRLTLAEQARMVSGAAGSSGHNVDYVRNTARHLAELGIRDRQVMALAALIEAAEAGGAGLQVA
jgi:cation transport protein ChaC